MELVDQVEQVRVLLGCRVEILVSTLLVEAHQEVEVLLVAPHQHQVV